LKDEKLLAQIPVLETKATLKKDLSWVDFQDKTSPVKEERDDNSLLVLAIQSRSFLETVSL
jgi:hypothetical protein